MTEDRYVLSFLHQRTRMLRLLERNRELTQNNRYKAKVAKEEG
jgi:hypothetical protein